MTSSYSVGGGAFDNCTGLDNKISHVTGTVAGAGTTMALYKHINTGTNLILQLAAGDISAGATIIGSVTYFTAS